MLGAIFAAFLYVLDLFSSPTSVCSLQVTNDPPFHFSNIYHCRKSHYDVLYIFTKTNGDVLSYRTGSGCFSTPNLQAALAECALNLYQSFRTNGSRWRLKAAKKQTVV